MKTFLGASCAILALSALVSAVPTKSEAQAEPFLGQIMMAGYTFCPRGWAEANGQVLPINQNAALFSLYGTQFGGDGRTTFALPDLRGRVPLHAGQGGGLSNRGVGQRGGAEAVTLNTNQLPGHTHGLNALSSGGDNPSPAGNLLANDGSDRIYGTGTPDTALADSAIGQTGGGQSVTTMPPFLVIRYCVALQGIFPSRS